MDRLGFDLILIGAPAAGKDTQAELLLKKYKFRPIESGKHWRKAAIQNNAIGKLVRATFSKGNPVPVKLMKKFLINQLRSAKKTHDLLFIGNPRLKPEAQFLTKLLKAKKRDYYVIGLTLTGKAIKARSLKRMRDDADWKYVDNRIRMYRLQVAKTLNYFRSINKLATVNGNRSIPNVAKDIEKIIHDYQRRKGNNDSQTKRPHLS
jgi:adenylate kinase